MGADYVSRYRQRAAVGAIVILIEGLFGVAHGAAARGTTAVVRHDGSAPKAAERGAKTPKPQFVRQAQRALRDLGYYGGPIDGIVGPQTHAALAKYQDAEQLPVTGTLDLETMTRLDIYRRLLRARAP